MTSPLFHYLLIHALISFIPIGLGLFVVLRNIRNPLYWAFLRYNFVISWWGLFTLFMEFSKTPQVALFWDRVSLLGIVFIPPTFLHFTWMYSGRSKYYNRILRICYGLSSFFFLMVFTPLMAKSATQKYIIPYFTDPGPAYHFFVLYFSIVMAFGNFLVFKAWLQCESERRKPGVLLFFIATFLSTVGGGGNFLVPYQVYVPILYPYGGYTFILYGILIAYTILRHSFLDIEVIIRKTLVFTGLFGMVIAVVGTVTTLTQGLIRRYLYISPTLSSALCVLIAILLYDPTRKWLIRVTDKFLFQKKEDFKVVLSRLSASIITIRHLNEVAETILSTLRELLKLHSGAIILKDEGEKGYYLLKSFNARMTDKNYDANDNLINYLSRYEGILNLEDETFKQKLPLVLLSSLEELNAVICIPLFFQKELLAILTLGRKKSDEEFTQEELGYFPTLAGQVVIALSNARYYEIERKNQFDFIQQAKMAAIGTLTAGINHEIKNPLNIIRTGVEMLKMNDESGLYDNHSTDEYRREVNPVLNSIMEEVDKASNIMTTLSMFAHKGKGDELRNEMVNLEKQMENVYALLKSEFKYNSIQFEKDFPPGLPYVVGDSARVSEVFLNIVNNARQAIGQNGKIKVAGRQNSNYVYVDIIDNGPGMTKEIRERIFDPFFTTKEQGEGTGLGLHICREMLKRMDAKIIVKSEVGKGTMFTIEFPIPRNDATEEKN